MTQSNTDSKSFLTYTVFKSHRGEGKTVHTLSENVARKIAAGEVIDRPNAILRELLDNCVDSGADKIIAEIENGGIDSIRVVDNGCGMSKEDLENCAYPHATSKITNEKDLDSLSTLGFRGEALASIAAVSRLSIQSARKKTGSWEMKVVIGKERELIPTNLAKGTIVHSQGLFENFPARRQFLKRPGTESVMCRQTFIEKAIPAPEIAFRLVIDKKIRLDLPLGQSLTTRFLSALGITENEKLFSEIHAYDTENTKPQWKITIILGTPDISRTDKKQMMVFVNGRRIQEYSMLQAIDYGAQGYFPNGTHPVAALFIELNPQFVDFNIHPAKKEVRFKNSAPIHHAISSTIRSFYHAQTVHDLANKDFFIQKTTILDEPRDLPVAKHKNVISGYKDFSATFSDEKSNSSERKANYSVSENFTQNNTSFEININRKWKYIGQALGVFLVVEKDDSLLLVDQHAGHERIRYNEFMETAGQKQQLLLPLIIETSEKEDDEYLEKLIPELSKAGFDIKNRGSGRWEIFSVPIKWEGTQKDLQNDLLEKRLSPTEIIRSIAATTACRGAIKDGNIIDRTTAEKLLDKIFALPEPRCPHGRPIWTAISKEELFNRVHR
jgi:DNA mismatch repair protein MutL